MNGMLSGMQQGCTPLHLACLRGRLAAVRELLADEFVDVNQSDQVNPPRAHSIPLSAVFYCTYRW